MNLTATIYKLACAEIIYEKYRPRNIFFLKFRRDLGTFGQHLPQLEQRMKLTWPRPCLLRPPFLLLKVCKIQKKHRIRNCRFVNNENWRKNIRSSIHITIFVKKKRELWELLAALLRQGLLQQTTTCKKAMRAYIYALSKP